MMTNKSFVKIFSLFFYICLYYNFVFSEEIVSNNVFHKKYNVLLISICSLRADHLGCYRYFRNTTPNLDRLAKAGILFENVFSQGPYTLPSIISIHTSLYPYSHGVMVILRDKLSNKVKTLAEILKSSGYKTALFANLTNPHIYINTGLGRGFEHIEHFVPDRQQFAREKLFKWIKENKTSPLFINVHLMYVHFPYCAPLKYQQKFVKGYKGKIISSMQELSDFRYQLIKSDLKNPHSEINKILKDEIILYPKIFQNDLDYKKFTKLQQLVNSLPMQKMIDFWGIYSSNKIFWLKVDRDNPNDIEHLKNLYDACILQLDSEFIGPLIDKLKNLKLYDNTLIMIVGDHGEQFLEHSDFRHGAFYDEIIHIPLIVKLPKELTHIQSRIRYLAQHIDIMPTILETLNMQVSNEAQGISLKAFWEDKRDSFRNKYVYSMGEHGESMRSESYKLIYHIDSHQYEFYNLKDDPKEKNNIYNQKSDIIKAIEDDFIQWKNNLVSYADKTNDFPPEIDEKTRERVRKFGYW